jgi:chemotaxis protein methyltransferase CheR
MGFNSDISKLRTGAESLLRDLIHEEVGLYFDDAKIDLMSDKLAPLIIARGFESFLDYYYLLKYDLEAAAGEWQNVVNALSVQETYFWREIDQIHQLADVIIPSLAARNPNRPIRIWSAACATGEEPLTIAMRLNENGWFEKAKIEIYASDASTTALERARTGIYRERSFRSLPAHLREKYFTAEGSKWRVAPFLQKKIKWKRANLLEFNETKDLVGVSIIFCRNVFIYFSSDAVRRVVDFFAEKMCLPGFLFVGAAESLLKITDDFELEEIGNGFVYVKRR